MPQKKFQLSTFFYFCVIFIVLVWLSFLYVIVSTINNSIKNEGMFQSAINVIILMTPFIFIFWMLYRETLTEFGEYEIVHYEFIGKTSIAWKDVQYLDRSLVRANIKSKHGKRIGLSLALYKNSDDVIDFINNKMKQFGEQESLKSTK